LFAAPRAFNGRLEGHLPLPLKRQNQGEDEQRLAVGAGALHRRQLLGAESLL
jgi:hypothetical protein